MGTNVSAGAAPLLVYDGECGFCSRVVQFLLRRDPGGELRFTSRHGIAGRGVRDRHPEFRDVEALLWVERADADREQVYAGADATLRAAAYLGGTYAALARFARMVPRPLRAGAYGVVARIRSRIFGPVDPTCMLVPDAERRRFLP